MVNDSWKSCWLWHSTLSSSKENYFSKFSSSENEPSFSLIYVLSRHRFGTSLSLIDTVWLNGIKSRKPKLHKFPSDSYSKDFYYRLVIWGFSISSHRLYSYFYCISNKDYVCCVSRLIGTKSVIYWVSCFVWWKIFWS